MNYLASNLRILRTIKQLRQKEIATAIQSTRAKIGSYEEGRCEPPIETIIRFSEFYKVKIDDLLKSDFSKVFKDYME